MANSLRIYLGDAEGLARAEVDGEPFADWAREQRAGAIAEDDLGEGIEAVMEAAEDLRLFSLVGCWRHLPPVIADLEERLTPRLADLAPALVPVLLEEVSRPVPADHAAITSLFVDPDWEGDKVVDPMQMQLLVAAARAELLADPEWAAAGQGEQRGTAWQAFCDQVDGSDVAAQDRFFLISWDW